MILERHRDEYRLRLRRYSHALVDADPATMEQAQQSSSTLFTHGEQVDANICVVATSVLSSCRLARLIEERLLTIIC